MQEDKIPKIFISYSWSSDGLTIPLAERLVSHGVDVVLDKWDLKEGQDKYAFMEKCVNDVEINKVLIICDKKYVEKANNREGGVGDETAIISTEIYGNVSQEKFIPVIAEHDENGKPFVPSYIKSRIYVDLSDDEKYEDEYEKLLRNIYEKPIFKKPKLGSKPQWLEQERTNLFSLKDLIRQTKGASSQKKQEALIKRFEMQHIEILKTYYSKDILDGKQVYDTWAELKEVRDYYLDWLGIFLEIDCDFGEILCELFETLYNTLIYEKTFDESLRSGRKFKLDVYKIYIWELFICTVTFLRHYEKYGVLNTILSNTYFLIESEFDGRTEPSNYATFRHYSQLLEQYKQTTEKKDLFTLMGNTLCLERERKPIYTKESLAQADLFLYQVFKGFDLVNDDTSYKNTYWFPTCYVYTQESVNEWKKMKSRRYCKKICTLFGVSNIEELKQKISKCTYKKEICYSGSFDTASVILNFIKVEDIGSMN